MEEREYHGIFVDRLIGPELHRTLLTRIAERKGQAERRPMRGEAGLTCGASRKCALRGILAKVVVSP